MGDRGAKGVMMEDEFWANVATGGPEECWPWTGSLTPDGYGINVAHRKAYELAHGPISDGLVVDHTCHNDTDCPGGYECPHRRCQNPAHLEAVSRGENVRRGRTGFDESTRTHCPHGHEYTPENTRIYRGNRFCRACAVVASGKQKKKASERRKAAEASKG
jgi:hypothetical protein